MNMANSNFDEECSLAALGIDEIEERAYRYLLMHHGANSAEVAKALSITRNKAQQLMDGIMAKGLATHTPERTRRYVPVPPDIAVGSLIFKQQENLKRAEAAILGLQKQAATRRAREPEQMVEVVNGEEVERHIFGQIHGTAQEEIVSLVRPPMRISKLGESAERDQHVQREAQERGVRYRTIVDSAFMSLPGAMARIRYDMEAGEKVRVVSELPVKMMVTDRRIAIVPLELHQSGGPALLVRSSALLETLYSLFEILWARATPIPLILQKKSGVLVSESDLAENMRDLISALAAGLNDKNAAAQLELAPRTYDRRIKELMSALDARTRFQAGWLAAIKFYGALR